MININIPKDNIIFQVNYSKKEVIKIYHYYILNLFKMYKYSENFKPILLKPLEIIGNNNINWNRYCDKKLDTYNPFLDKFQNNKTNLGLDIYQRGMYSPLIVEQKNNKYYLVEGRHKLFSLQECVKNNLIDDNYKIICTLVPSSINNMINKNETVEKILKNKKNYLFLPSLLCEYKNFKVFKIINKNINLIEIDEDVEFFFVNALFFNFLVPLLFHYNIKPSEKLNNKEWL